MKHFWLLSLLLVWPCAAAEPPFAPQPNVPDYVASFALDPGWGSKRRDSQTVRHHQGWYRIDTVTDRRFRSTTYVGPGPLSSELRGSASEGARSLTIQRGPQVNRSVGWTYDPSKTADHDIVLGESCDIWNVARTSSGGAGSGWKKLSCISRDGIELKQGFANDQNEGSSAEAISIERKPVAPADVQPPKDVLDLKSWSAMTETTGAHPAGAPGDAIVLMKTERLSPSGQPMLRRTVRRHYPWTYTEDVDGEGRRQLTIVSAPERLTVRFKSDAAGAYTMLSIQKVAANTDEFGPKALGKSETIAGEQCAWLDMTPGMSDAGLSQCRTPDGLVLKEESWSRGSRSEPLVAALLRRTPVNMVEVLPPPSILTRANWGIPE